MSGWIVLIAMIVLLPVVLLSVPLTFNAKGRTVDPQLELKISWGRGLIAAVIETNGRKTAFRLRLALITLPSPRKQPGTAKKAAKQSGQQKGQKEKVGKEKQGFSLPALSDVISRQLLAEVMGYLKRLFKSIRLRLRLSGVYGTDDPALTGLIAGLMATLRTKHYNINLDADFSEPILDVTGETSGRVVPGVILWFTIRLLLSKPVRKLWWTQLKKKLAGKSIKKSKEAARHV